MTKFLQISWLMFSLQNIIVNVIDFWEVLTHYLCIATTEENFGN